MHTFEVWQNPQTEQINLTKLLLKVHQIVIQPEAKIHRMHAHWFQAIIQDFCEEVAVSVWHASCTTKVLVKMFMKLWQCTKEAAPSKHLDIWSDGKAISAGKDLTSCLGISYVYIGYGGGYRAVAETWNINTHTHKTTKVYRKYCFIPEGVVIYF